MARRAASPETRSRGRRFAGIEDLKMIKLLALDLDGTLLNGQGRVSEQNRNAIRQAEDRGVLVTIATGRRFRDARPVGIDLALNAPLITHNGALIKFGETLETVDADILESETAAAVVDLGKQLGGDALISVDPEGFGTLLYDRISETNIPLQKYIRWAEHLHGSEASSNVIHVADIAEHIRGESVIHVSFSGRCGSMAELAAEIGRNFGGRITVLSTIYTELDLTLIDILPENSSKGSGVARLAAINGIEPHEVMAIGDNFNDREMLEFAGTPVVMANAAAGLVENRNYFHTASNLEHGVARAIERFILS